ncbi:hypothetical protein BJ085DRAFT_31040 [Dimargaris cristalligena]|uniref:Uncharacterized protein n=1 Tax=Dimargaris cristalligena TaxID=215637 RepID=A0A4P9ZJ15_9FUNG|nr:hypothetical protein BJ085DRAFT_31040 [Dimargaris cristalligena]|eukprot:RKP33216.1 hypothetical protein BJ085DRAFT_31040 [Dimargaris cristalligena]
MDYLNSYNQSINNFMSPLDNPPVMAFLKLFLIVYGSMIAPHLPDYILKWFNFVPFKIFVLFLIVWTSNHDPTVALLIAVGFTVSINVLSGKKAFEAFRGVNTLGV